MKNILMGLSVAFMLIFSSNNASAGIVIDKSGGGPGGYNKVNESHENGGHSLTCYESGSTKCEWSIKPQLLTIQGSYDIDDITAQIEAAISNYTYQGSFNLDNEIFISWYGQSVTDYHVVIQ
jgi:hypothetical protein